MGKEAASPPPPPLRTVLAIFTAHGSSRSKRPFPLAGRAATVELNLLQLHDTDLVLPNDLLSAGAPARPKSAVICFPALGWFAKFSRDERPGGILPAFAWSDLASRLVSRTLTTSATPIPPITGRHWLSPPSSTRRPISVPRGSLSFGKAGKPTGLPRSVPVTCVG